jgi:hypothetical protein
MTNIQLIAAAENGALLSREEIEQVCREALEARAQKVSLRSTAEAGDGIEHLELSVRAYNCLKRAHIDTLGKLQAVSATQLLEIRDLGITTLSEIRALLLRLGLPSEIEKGAREKICADCIRVLSAGEVNGSGRRFYCPDCAALREWADSQERIGQ